MRLARNTPSSKASRIPPFTSKPTRPFVRSLGRDIFCQACPDVQESYLTCPIVGETTELLSNMETAPAPLWSSWCGTASGLWVGKVAAFNPSTGHQEPISKGKDGKGLLLSMYQCCVEEQTVGGDDGQAQYSRYIARGSTVSELEEEMTAAAVREFEPNSNNHTIDWGEEHMNLGQPGLAIFDGGSFSSGPVVLCGSENSMDHAKLHESTASQAGKGKTSVIESCLQWGGAHRVRVLCTLYSELVETEQEGNGGEPYFEVDVSLLRVVLCLEAWEGAPGQYSNKFQSEVERLEQDESSQVRLSSEGIVGFWNTFETSWRTVSDIDMRTGRQAMLPVYSTREIQQLLRMEDGPESLIDGGTLWLPHRVALQVTQSSEGLEFSTFWKPDNKVLVSVVRCYDVCGMLTEVNLNTCVRK